MSLFKKIVAGITVAALTVSLTACGGDTSWAYKDNNATVTSGLYLYYLTQATSQAESQVELQDKETVFTKGKEIDGKSTTDWIKEETEKACKQYLAVEAQFKELGLELTDEDQETIDQQVDYYYPSFDQYYMFSARGIGESSYRLSVENNIKYSKLFEKYYKAGGIEEVSESEMKTFFQDNYAKVKVVTLNKTNSSTGQALSEEEITALKETADGYVKRINEDGESIDTIYTEYKASTSTDSSSTSSSSSNSELNYSFYYKEGTNMAEAVKTAIFETSEIGGPAITFEDDNAVYVLQKYDHMADPADFTKYTDSVLQYMRSDDFEAKVEEWTGAVQCQTNSSTLSKYTAKKLNDKVEKAKKKAAASSSLAAAS